MIERYPSNLGPLDHVLGGGLVPNSVVLLDGKAGTGKTTLAMQWAGSLGLSCLYVCADESVMQALQRAVRLCINHKRISVFHTTEIGAVIEHAAAYDVLVVDPIQAFMCAGIAGSPGSPEQMTACTRRLIEFVKGVRKERDMSAILINQTAIAYLPNKMHHMVDVVLNLEAGDDGVHILDSSKKNRFGPATAAKLLFTSIGFSSMQ